MGTITKDIEIDIGHRIIQHESKCKNVHGHRIKVRIHLSAEKLDFAGRVVDFGVVKEVIGGWLNDYLDHGFVANPNDPIIPYLKSEGSKYWVMDFPATREMYSNLRDQNRKSAGENWFNDVEDFYEDDLGNLEPTSENLARMILEQCILLSRATPKLDGISITEIECYETPTASASFTQKELFEIWQQYVRFRPNQKENKAPWYQSWLAPVPNSGEGSNPPPGPPSDDEISF